MIEKPPVFAATPPQRVGPDLLSEVLRAVRVRGSVFLNARFTEPFAVADEHRYDDTPMARLRHVSVLHLITAGQCEFEFGSQRHALGAGDVIFHPYPGAYRFFSGRAQRTVSASEIVHRGPIEGVWLADHGGGGTEVRMVCGFIESIELQSLPLFRTLPAVSVVRAAEDRVGALIASAVREIAALADAAAPGSDAVLGRLMELLFVELLRWHVAQLPAQACGWLAALNDPVVGRALHLLHAQPAHRWTVAELALRVASSRSALNDRFKAVIGHPPIDYLALWRIRLASERLHAGSDGIERIAAGVGYESEAAFNRAFKRITGMTPGQWRDHARPS